MGRDYRNYERNERRGFGGRDNWDADINEGSDPDTRDRPTRRSGWEGSPVTSYREADPREVRGRDGDWRDSRRGDQDRYGDRDRPQRVNWGRKQDDERRMSRGYELDRDVFRSGDRDEWRGEFGPKEDRTQWGRSSDRDRSGGWRRPSGSFDRPERDDLPERDGTPGSRGFGEMGDVRIRSRRDYERDEGWAGAPGFASGGDQPRGAGRDRNWGGAIQPGWNTGQLSTETAGRHAGRGPRGYQRSDERIREDVAEILWEHGEIDASDIDVTVANGEVTLEGTVDSRWTKRMAEDAAYKARGVNDVHNRLRVRRDQPANRDPGANTRTSARGTTGAIEMEGGRVATEPRLVVDMTVVGADGDEVGVIKEVRNDTVLVDRPIARDLYIPHSAIETTDGSTARLNINSSDIDNQGWQNPPLTGADTDYEQNVQMT